MKTLICAMIISVSTLASATEAPHQENVDKVLERVDAAGQWVSTTLENLADKLGTTVSYLWPTYVRQVMAEGARAVLLGLFLMALGLCIYFNFQKRSKTIRADDKYNRSDDDAAGAYSIFSYILLLALTIGGAVLASYGVVDLVAPEPTALKNIVDAIKQIK